MKSARSLITLAVASFGLVAACFALPSVAHHSFGFYDVKKSVEVEGTVERYEWSNPHSWLFISVDAPAGATTYGFEMVSVGEMLRKGWAKNSVKPGDKIKVTYHPIKDGTTNGLLQSAKHDDGTLIGRPPEQ